MRSGPVAAAKEKYEQFAALVQEAGVRKVAFGEFQAEMQVLIQNDGPVTLLLDSQKTF